MVTAYIDGIKVHVAPGTTILEAARETGVEIPTLCKHDDLPAGAGCGICMVRHRNTENMLRACATPLREGMDIVTNDPGIVRIRRTVLELILSNHPNECLSCGRNGTCELQKLAERFGIRRETFPMLLRHQDRDESTRSIVLEPRKCIKCGRCLTVCQEKQDVWALCFLERGLNTHIVPAGEISLAESPCVRCGQCSAHCPVGAIMEYDQTEEVWEALRNPELYCVAQIAPAVRVSIGESFNYPPGTNLSGQIYHVLRRMGFDAVFDTNFGADVTIVEEASEFARRFAKSPDTLPLVTTCCPAWVDFMEKFHSDMIPCFSSCKSPHAILGTLTKTYYAEKKGLNPESIYMVSIMPCTAKKFEITRGKTMFASGQQDVDISITTRELVRIIQQSGLHFESLNCLEQPDSPLGDYSGAGVIFGASGGVMEAALRSAEYYLTGKDGTQLEFEEIHGLKGIKEMKTMVAGKEVRVAVAHGLANVEEVMNRVRKAKDAGTEPPYHFIEVMACPGGCIGGGGQSWKVNDAIRRARAEGLRKDDRLREVRLSHRNPAVNKIYDEFLGEPLGEKAHGLLHTHYTHRPQYKR